MTRDEYEQIPNMKRIEAGDTILFYYPGERAPEHHIKVESVYEIMSSGKSCMMALEESKMLPCVNRSDVISGKVNHTAIFRKNSYDLDYCAIELKGDFPDV